MLDKHQKQSPCEPPARGVMVQEQVCIGYGSQRCPMMRCQGDEIFDHMLWYTYQVIDCSIGHTWTSICMRLAFRATSTSLTVSAPGSVAFTYTPIHTYKNAFPFLLPRHLTMYLEPLPFLLLLAAWTSRAAVPTPRAALEGTWSTLPNITLNGVQYPRQEHSVVVLDDDMYVLGGILPFDGTTYPTVNIVQKLNFVTNTWTGVSPMPAALNHVNVAVVRGKIYYLGGLAVTATGGPAYWNASAACAVYDPVADDWTVLPDMPKGRAVGSAATMVVGDTIYLPGGLLNTNLTNDEEGTTAMFTSYNVTTREWAVLPDLPAPRDHAGKGQSAEMLYILGGRAHGHWNVVDTVFGYDIDTRSWSTDLAPMPTGRGGCASATIGHMMFTAGGEGDPNTTTHVWPQMQAYDAVSNTWSNYTDMATPVHGTAAVAYRGKVIIPGGGLEVGGEPTQLVQTFTP